MFHCLAQRKTGRKSGMQRGFPVQFPEVAAAEIAFVAANPLSLRNGGKGFFQSEREFRHNLAREMMGNVVQGDVVVVGSLNADFVMQVEQLPLPGQTVRGSALRIVSGGKGANQAVAAARSGASTAMVGCVGDDDYGRRLLADLTASGVAVEAVEQVKGVQTGLALILVDGEGRNQIAISAGANGQVTTARLETLLSGGSVGKVWLLQLEIPMESVVFAAKKAKSAGAFVILDPAPAAALPAELLAAVDLITPNETETQVLTGIEVTDVDRAEEAAARLQEQGVPAVLIKMGAKGALLVDDAGSYYVPAVSVDPVDTTAAGDAFNGALAAALSAGLDVRAAMRWASVASALSVTKEGAIPSLPAAAEVAAFIAQRPELADTPVPYPGK